MCRGSALPKTRPRCSPRSTPLSPPTRPAHSTPTLTRKRGREVRVPAARDGIRDSDILDITLCVRGTHDPLLSIRGTPRLPVAPAWCDRELGGDRRLPRGAAGGGRGRARQSCPRDRWAGNRG